MTKYEAVRAKIVEAVNEICTMCGGDGKETCDNPDHGFIDALVFSDVGRLGCPVCGHSGNHKVKNGGPCEDCNGTGYFEHKEPIRLSHVLRAIKADGEPSVEFPSLTMTLKGRFKNTTCHLLDRWDLTKDDLSLQSPDTIDFLFKILCE